MMMPITAATGITTAIVTVIGIGIGTAIMIAAGVAMETTIATTATIADRGSGAAMTMMPMTATTTMAAGGTSVTMTTMPMTATTTAAAHTVTRPAIMATDIQAGAMAEAATAAALTKSAIRTGQNKPPGGQRRTKPFIPNPRKATPPT